MFLKVQFYGVTWSLMPLLLQHKYTPCVSDNKNHSFRDHIQCFLATEVSLLTQNVCRNLQTNPGYSIQ